MAEFGNVYMSDTDGNIGNAVSVPSDAISGLLFDISKQGSTFWTAGKGSEIAENWQDTVVELNSLEDAVRLGITPYTGETEEVTVGSGGEATSATVSKDLIAGIPYYHIQQYFGRTGGTGRLFVMFADCSQNWNALTQMQRAANGMISQIGVWTEQQCWSKSSSETTVYTSSMVGALNNVAKKLADEYFSPVVILLCANTSKVKIGAVTSNEVDFAQIPDMTTADNRYVAHLLSQSRSEEVRRMQALLPSTTPVGCVGLALGALTEVNVAQCIGWVARMNLVGYVDDIEFGFGDSTLSGEYLANATRYASLTPSQLGDLSAKGYVFLRTYEGREGSYYFTVDRTCTNGDYNTIARNRTINKSRRLVREAQLPYVNSSVEVAAGTGSLSPATVTQYINAVSDALNTMVISGEASSIGTISIPANQNILQTRRLDMSYFIVPFGCTELIKVTEGLTI